LTLAAIEKQTIRFCETGDNDQRLKGARRSRPSLYCDGEEPSVPVQPVERKLAAIFAADIAGYSRLMARDEVGTLARLKTCRAIIDGLIASYRGRVYGMRRATENWSARRGRHSSR